MLEFIVVDYNIKESSRPMPLELFQGYTVNTSYNEEAKAIAYHKVSRSLGTPVYQVWGLQHTICSLSAPVALRAIYETGLWSPCWRFQALFFLNGLGDYDPGDPQRIIYALCPQCLSHSLRQM